MVKKKSNFAMSNRLLYTFIVIGLLAVMGVIVYAAAPNPGHSGSQLDLSDGVNGNAVFNGNVITNNLVASSGNLGVSGGGWGVDVFLDIDGGSSDAFRVLDTGVEKFRIDGNTGNVGIGTPTPGNKLSVAGNADVSGNLGVTGSVTAGSLSVGSISATGSVNAGSFIGDGSQLTNLPSSYTPKQVVGSTSASYDGSGIGGYSGGDAKCAVQFGTGARMSHAGDFPSGRPTTDGWYNSFLSSTTTGSVVLNDCNGWSTTINGFFGPSWISSNGYPTYSPCDIARQILCST